jgi:hypothetical protein
MVKLAAGVRPNITAVAPVNPEPVTVTGVPPASGPVAGDIPVTAGTGEYTNLSEGEVTLVPPGVVTVISIVPAAWAGEVTFIRVSESTVKTEAESVPNRTSVVPVKPVPVIMTNVPPATGPVAGEIPEMAGTG